MGVRLFLHIGLHKTGTTFLQKNVFSSWSGIHYVGKPYSDQFFEPVLRDEGISAVLMSNEQFSSPPIYPVLLDPALRERPWFEQRKVTLLRLKDIFPEAKVLLGLREPADFCESVYSQYIFRGGSASLSEFWRPHDNSGCLCLEDVRFDSLIEFVEKLWPGSFYFDHSDLRSKPAELLSSMGWFMGVNESPPIVSEEVNLRLSSSQVSAMQAYSSAQSLQGVRTKGFYRGLRAARDGANKDEPFSFPSTVREEITMLSTMSWEKARSRMTLCS